MHYLEFGTVLDDMATEELAPYGPVRSVHFIHHNHTDVYRIQTASTSLIAQATPDRKAYLERVRTNLDRLTPLCDRSIPRVLAWRAGDLALAGREWAVLVYREMRGQPLSRRNFTTGAWARLSATLERLHALEADPEASGGPVARGCDPVQFPAFARALRLRLEDLPIETGRVRSHLDAMADFVTRHAGSFEVPRRLIHGDLDRKNIVSVEDEVGLLDWADLGAGDYAFDLGMLKFMLDSVAPGQGAALIREQARHYRQRFQDSTLETRLRFFLALPGLLRAFHALDDTGAFGPARTWRVRTSYLHSETQWKTPLCLDGPSTGAPAVRTEQWALELQQPLRGLFYLLAPKRVA